MVSIIFYLACVGFLFSASFLLPATMAFAFEEFDAAFRLTVYFILSAFLSSATLLAIWGKGGKLPRLGGLHLVVAGWLMFPVIAAIPLVDIGNLDAASAYFDALSGLTTTGSSAFAVETNVPRSLLMYRSQLEWLGGLCTLLTFVLFIGPSGIGGLPEGQLSRQAGKFYATPWRTMQLTKKISQAYLLTTIICMAAMLFTGTQPYDAFFLSIISVSSGGFLPPGSEIHQVTGNGGMLVMSAFFVIAATSILWHRAIIRGNFEEIRVHRESYWVIAMMLAMAVVLAAQIYSSSGARSADVVIDTAIEGLFNATSLVATSGIQSRPGIFALMPPILIVLILILGASAFSTAGGIKYFRVGGMLSQSLFELNRLIYPHGIRPGHFGSQSFDIQMMKAIWSFFTAAVFTIVLGAFLLSVTSMDFEAAFLASTAAFSNAGPAYGPEWGPPTHPGWPAYYDMATSSQLILCVIMLLGRLEIFAVLAVIRIRGR